MLMISATCAFDGHLMGFLYDSGAILYPFSFLTCFVLIDFESVMITKVCEKVKANLAKWHDACNILRHERNDT